MNLCLLMFLMSMIWVDGWLLVLMVVSVIVFGLGSLVVSVFLN